MKKLCFSTYGENCYNNNGKLIELYQTGLNRFTVYYGLHVKENLDYSQAAKEIGECILHNAACQGYLDDITHRSALAKRLIGEVIKDGSFNSNDE